MVVAISGTSLSRPHNSLSPCTPEKSSEGVVALMSQAAAEVAHIGTLTGSERSVLGSDAVVAHAGTLTVPGRPVLGSDTAVVHTGKLTGSERSVLGSNSDGVFTENLSPAVPCTEEHCVTFRGTKAE